LTNRELAVPRDELVELPEDTYYVFDIVGCMVIDEKDDTPLGEVVDVETYPTNDAYIVRMADGSRRMLPATKQGLKVIDIEKKRIVVDTDNLLEFE
jgi:16S rRNA processing protein RimM